MKIGITASRHGITDEQRFVLRGILRIAAEVHHGDCVGGDAAAHRLVKELQASGKRIRIVVHPPNKEQHRAFCRGATEVRPEKPYLDRNKDIVDETDCVVALPNGFQEELRSGTWSTARYGKRRGRRVTIIYPDGTTHFWNEGNTACDETNFLLKRGES